MDETYEVTVKGRVTPQGVVINIDTSPVNMFGDAILDLLQRAARFVEREHTAAAVLTQLKNDRINQQMRDKGIIMP